MLELTMSGRRVSSKPAPLCLDFAVKLTKFALLRRQTRIRCVAIPNGDHVRCHQP